MVSFVERFFHIYVMYLYYQYQDHQMNFAKPHLKPDVAHVSTGFPHGSERFRSLWVKDNLDMPKWLVVNQPLNYMHSEWKIDKYIPGTVVTLPS